MATLLHALDVDVQLVILDMVRRPEYLHLIMCSDMGL